jgi:uncharacterized membrane protein YesL
MIDQKLRDRVTDTYLSLIPLISLNIIWFVCCVPLVTAIPSTAALFYATNRLAHGGNADWRTFFEGFRVCFRRSWGWGVLNVLVVVGLVSNFLFFSQQLQGVVRVWAGAAVIVVAFLWLSVQLYTFPLLLEQEQPRLLLALRNSLIALLKRPFRTFAFTLVVLAIAGVSTLVLVPLWVFISASLCAYIANRATLVAIAVIMGRPLPGSAIEQATAPDTGLNRSE